MLVYCTNRRNLANTTATVKRFYVELLKKRILFWFDEPVSAENVGKTNIDRK